MEPVSHAFVENCPFGHQACQHNVQWELQEKRISWFWNRLGFKVITVGEYRNEVQRHVSVC